MRDEAFHAGREAAAAGRNDWAPYPRLDPRRHDYVAGWRSWHRDQREAREWHEWWAGTAGE